jgi:hypothetical protein
MLLPLVWEPQGQGQWIQDHVLSGGRAAARLLIANLSQKNKYSSYFCVCLWDWRSHRETWIQSLVRCRRTPNQSFCDLSILKAQQALCREIHGWYFIFLFFSCAELEDHPKLKQLWARHMKAGSGAGFMCNTAEVKFRQLTTFFGPGLTWNLDPPNLSFLHSLGWQACHHAQLLIVLIEMVVLQTFYWDGLEPWSSWSQLPK